jgi:rod shape determining protein RodA
MLRIDRRLIAHFEWPLLVIVLLITAVGLATVVSATYTSARPLSPYAVRQLAWTGIGLIGLVAMLCFDYRIFDRYGYAAYALTLVLLLLVPLIGVAGGGARRWLSLGPLALQPSEFMKVGLVVALARHLHRRVGEPRLAVRWLLSSALLFAVPAYLILTQPDLGTVIALGLGTFTVLLVAGLPWRVILLAALVVGPAVPFAWPHLKPYQQQRILTFVNPQADPLGAGYHVIQSRIAIGSGMVAGKGYLRGTQNQLNFIPEQHTDFVFAVFAEEWGFLGSSLLLLLYSALVLRGAVIASKARDNLGALLAAGLIATVFWQAVINIGMTTGSLPVVGITLPFLSYGGSSMLALMTSVGMVMNVSMRRYTF